MTSDNNNSLMLFSGTSAPMFASAVADYLGIKLGGLIVSKFPSGEIYTRIKDNVRGKSVFLVQTGSNNVNEDIMELLIMIDAMKRASCRSITAVIPHLPYARQDRKAASREPISAKLIADLLTAAGVTRVITIDMHSDQIQGFFNIPVDNLTAMPLFASYLKSKNLKNPVIVAPDTGRAKTSKKLADRIGAPLAIIHKQRPEHSKSEVTHVVGDVKGKTVIIVDDMIDTAGTATNGVKTLLELGAEEDIYLMATHPLLSDPAVERITKVGIKECIVTDSIPVPKEKQFPALKVLSVAPLFGEAIKRAFDNLSISSLFD
ncbi:MAG: ribose-phosphate pyrophosphokinase [Candidatus Margulisiibacteriota bacterium]